MKRARKVMVVATGMLALGAALATTGCSPKFERIDFTYDAEPPVTSAVSFASVQIPEGVVVAVTARPIAESGQVMPADTYVDLKPKDPAILGVAFALPQTQRRAADEAEWSFVLFGARAGMTTVDVRVGNETVATIPAVVAAQ